MRGLEARSRQSSDVAGTERGAQARRFLVVGVRVALARVGRRGDGTYGASKWAGVAVAVEPVGGFLTANERGTICQPLGKHNLLSEAGTTNSVINDPTRLAKRF